MATDNILRTYGDQSAMESVVLDAVEILTAEENYIQNILGRSVAINTIHSNEVDTLATAGSLAVAEAGDYTATARTTPTHLTNLVANIAQPYKVSRTQQRIKHYHGEDELRRQTDKALREWSNGFEYDIVRSSLVSGASGTIPKMAGIIEQTSKSTNHTTHNSGTVWSATILDSLMEDNWNNSNGDVATELFLGSVLRKKTDDFTQKTNIVVNQPGGLTRIVRTVSTYETAFGTLNIHKHRYIQQTADATARVLAINPEKIKIAWLEKPYIDTNLARSGDYDVRAVVGKATIEVRNQDSNWFAEGFLKG